MEILLTEQLTFNSMNETKKKKKCHQKKIRRETYQAQSFQHAIIIVNRTLQV